MSPSLPPLSLYIHIPWCVRKCPYCDFNSHNAPQALPQREYVAALLADLDRDLPLAQGRPLRSIFFGGGTPSLFAPENMARILDGVAARLAFAPGIEITMETNPGTVEHGDFKAYRRAGINRLSFGVQSFDDAALQRIGRIHDAAQAERAIKRAQDDGLDNLNLDLMYALPQQTIDGALADIERAMAFDTPHLSHYQLTLEPNTSFAANPPPLPDEDSAWDMQEACQTRIAAAGFGHYEVSAYARPGRESVHNLNYWHFGDYLGIGAGAHGKYTAPSPPAALSSGERKDAAPSPPTAVSSGERVGVRGALDLDLALGNERKAPPHPTLSPAASGEGEGFDVPRHGKPSPAASGEGEGFEVQRHGKISAAASGEGEGFCVRRRWKLRSPRGYLEHAQSERVIGGDDAVARAQLPFEFMLNGLRLTSGIPLVDFHATTGLDFDAIRLPMEEGVRRGWLVPDRERLQPTDAGQRFLNDLITLFLPDKRRAAL